MVLWPPAKATRCSNDGATAGAARPQKRRGAAMTVLRPPVGAEGWAASSRGSDDRMARATGRCRVELGRGLQYPPRGKRQERYRDTRECSPVMPRAVPDGRGAGAAAGPLQTSPRIRRGPIVYYRKRNCRASPAISVY